MDFMTQLSSLLGKGSDYLTEYKRFKKAIGQNPNDYRLKVEFIKFCLMNRFTKHDVVEEHIAEAIRLFEGIAGADSFDMQCHYLVGKFYQEEKDTRKAYRIYLGAIKRFNQEVIKHPELKEENTELAYSIALNLMTLQSNPVDPEVEQCFRIIRKSFPLHLKRIEYENEMAKPAPDKLRIKQLTDEIRKLRADEEKIVETAPKQEKAVSAAQVEKVATPAQPKAKETKEGKGIFSKLFSELSPHSVGLTSKEPQKTKSTEEEKMDSFKFSPPQEALQHASAFMVYHSGAWEGPYTYLQLSSMGFLEPSTWICRMGSQQVIQAYEMPDLQNIFQKQV